MGEVKKQLMAVTENDMSDPDFEYEQYAQEQRDIAEEQLRKE